MILSPLLVRLTPSCDSGFSFVIGLGRVSPFQGSLDNAVPFVHGIYLSSLPLDDCYSLSRVQPKQHFLSEAPLFPPPLKVVVLPFEAVAVPYTHTCHNRHELVYM